MFLKRLRWCLALCLLGLSFSFTATYAYSDRIVAVVNDDVITQSEVQKQVDERKKQLVQANVSLPSEGELRHNVLDELIDRALILQIAERNKFKVSDKDVDASVADVAKHNNLTVAQLQQELQKVGVNFKDYRQKIAEEMTIRRIQQQAVGSKVVVSDQDVANYMHKAKAFHEAAGERMYHIVDFLLPITGDVSVQEKQAAEKVIFEIIDRLQKGETPSQITQTIKFAGKALEVNDLGMRKLSELPDIFVSPVVNLKSGEIAGPIPAPNGLHVIKVLGMQSIEGARATTFTLDDARQMAFQHKFEEALRPWMQQLRSTAYIKIND